MVMMTWRIKTRSSLVTEHKVTVAYAMHEAHWNGVSRTALTTRMAAIPELKATRCRAGFLMPRPRVLLVDDDPDIRELLIAKLGEDGFDVTEACDVNEALRHIASNSFDYSSAICICQAQQMA